MTERQKVLEDNLGLVHWFAWKRAPAWARRMAGGRRALIADLYEPYVNGVDAWLASARESKLSTYVVSNLSWELPKLAEASRLIRVPNGDSRCAWLNAHRRLMRKLGVCCFHGSEGRSGDSSLLTFDTRDYEDRATAKQLVRAALAKLRSNHRLVVQLRHGLRTDLHTGISDCTYAEIAYIIQRSRSLPQQILHSAYRIIRDYLCDRPHLLQDLDLLDDEWLQRLLRGKQRERATCRERERLYAQDLPIPPLHRTVFSNRYMRG